jgi:hypothetical protein
MPFRYWLSGSIGMQRMVRPRPAHVQDARLPPRAMHAPGDGIGELAGADVMRAGGDEQEAAALDQRRRERASLP